MAAKKLKRKALYAGSFDPFTNGHLDLLKRASRVFDEVHIGIGFNPNKPGMFTVEERVELISRICRSFKNVKVSVFSGLTAVYAKKLGCRVLVRGLRDAQDFGFELQMAHMNRHLDDGLETIFIPTLQQYSEISSSLVKEVATLGGDVGNFLPSIAAKALIEKAKLIKNLRNIAVKSPDYDSEKNKASSRPKKSH